MGMRGGGDPLGRDAVISYSVVIPDNLVHRHCAMEDFGYVVVRKNVMRQSVVAEVFDRNKRVTIRMEPKIEIKAHGMAVIRETQARPEVSHWR